MDVDKPSRLFGLMGAALGLVLLVGIAAIQIGLYPEGLQGSELLLQVPMLLLAAGGFVLTFRMWQDGLEKPTNPVKPIRWTELHAEMEASDFLNWRTRLSKTLVGRSAEKKELLEWAKSGVGVEVRFLSGLGGAGKTRLAFEVADALRGEGWNAGEAEEKAAELLPKADHRRLFLIVDYPEDDPDRTKAILQALVDLPPDAGPVRALFVSRYTKERWEIEIGQIDSKLLSVRATRRTLTLLKLDEDQAVEVFRNSVERCAGALGKPSPEVPEHSVRKWLQGGRDGNLFHLPLFVSAAAVHCVLNDANVVDLSSAEVMTALVKRETRRMRGIGKEDGASQENPLVERLVALATIKSGLDVEVLRSLGEAPPEGLALPKNVIDWVETLDWWSESDRVLQPLRPDALGASLVFEVLKNRSEDAPEWLWAVLGSAPEKDRPTWLAAVERIDYDIRRVYGHKEGRFAGWLAAMVAGKLERAQALEYVSRGHRVAGTLDLSLAIVRELLRRAEESQAGLDLEDSETKQAERATHFNNYSNHLSAQGEAAEALEVIESAVEIYRRLADQQPGRYEPALATSLMNYSSCLSAQGNAAEALEAIEEAVEIYRRLVEQQSERYEPELARILTNCSICLSEQGKAGQALKASEEAVEVYRRLVEQTPERYEPDLALSLTNYSVHLGAQGKAEKALKAIEEAVEIYRRLAEQQPARYEPALALSLTNYSAHRSAQGKAGQALEAIEEAVEIRRRLAEQTPERYEPDLALSLTSYSNSLGDQGKATEALEASEQAVEIYRRLAEQEPERYEPALATSLTSYSSSLSDQGKTAEALKAIEQAVEIYGRLAKQTPERYEPDLALRLSILGDRREQSGEMGKALEHCEEALRLFRKNQEQSPGFVGRYLPTVKRDLERLRGLLGEDG